MAEDLSPVDSQTLDSLTPRTDAASAGSNTPPYGEGPGRASSPGCIDFVKDVFPVELEHITQRHERIAERHERIAQLKKSGKDGKTYQPRDILRHEKIARRHTRIAAWLEKTAQVQAPASADVTPNPSPGSKSKPKEESADHGNESKRFAGARPSTKLGLLGLALSGGGIRSATFNLGVLQALAHHGILQMVDYMSTVSGGGYLGGCLSSVLNRDFTTADGKEFPFAADEKGLERNAIKQLRNSSNYLAPSGLVDWIRIPALLLRGILINLLVIFPYLILAIWFTQVLCGAELDAAAKVPEIKNYLNTPFFFGALIAGLAWFLISPAVEKTVSKSGFNVRNGYERSFAYVVLILLLLLAVLGLPTILSAYHHAKTVGGSLSGVATTATKWWTIAVAAFPFVFAGKASESVHRLGGRLALFALGLLGPLILLLVYLNLADRVIYDDQIGSTWLFIAWLILWVLTLAVVDVNKTSLHFFYRDRLSKAYLFKLEPRRKGSQEARQPGGVTTEDQYDVESNDPQKLSDLNIDKSVAPYHLINCAVNLQSSDDKDLRGRNSDFFVFSKRFVGGERTGYCPTKEIEAIHPHLNLGTAIAISGAAATPNMGTTTIKPLVFIMTLLNVRLGYWLPNPRQIHRTGVRLLAGRGVGPIYLLKELVSRLHEKSYYVNLSDGGHIENLGIYELLRRRCKFIIASDAEADKNMSFHGLATVIRYARIDLGIDIEIELDEVRKDVDGMSRKSCALGKIRYPPIEPGAEPETGHLLYLKSSLCGLETEYIREYRSRNTDFPHESTGDQFFDETQFEAYRALGHHTGNLLFQEAALTDSGEDDQRLTLPSEDVDNWFAELKSILRPRFALADRFMGLQAQLGEIEKAFEDPTVAAYTYQIYPEVAPTRWSDKDLLDSGETSSLYDPKGERYRRIFHLCNLQLQMMENALIALELDRPENREHYFNRGWMNLFRRWSGASYFRRAWAVSIGTYSVGFQRFCEEALGLEIEVRSAPSEWDDLTEREKEFITDRKLHGFVSTRDRRHNGYQYDVWLAQLWVRLDRRGKDDPKNSTFWDNFPIGCSIVRSPLASTGRNGANPEIIFYRIRGYYRQMRLFERMIEGLGDALIREAAGRSAAAENSARPITPVVVFPTEDEENFRRYAYFFERCGLEVKRADVVREARVSQQPAVAD